MSQFEIGSVIWGLYLQGSVEQVLYFIIVLAYQKKWLPGGTILSLECLVSMCLLLVSPRRSYTKWGKVWLHLVYYFTIISNARSPFVRYRNIIVLRKDRISSKVDFVNLQPIDWLSICRFCVQSWAVLSNV